MGHTVTLRVQSVHSDNAVSMFVFAFSVGVYRDGLILEQTAYFGADLCLPSAIALFISLFIDILFVVLHVAEGCLLNLESK